MPVLTDLINKVTKVDQEAAAIEKADRTKIPAVQVSTAQLHTTLSVAESAKSSSEARSMQPLSSGVHQLLLSSEARPSVN